jgi:opacity protein-like surface antigen
MKKTIIVAVLLLITSVSAFAQDEFPKFELMGAVNLFKADIDVLSDETMWGYAIAGQYNVNRWFGIVGEWAAAHGESDFTFDGDIYPLDTRVQTLLFGPRFSYRASAVTLFGHWLLGAGTNKIDDDTGNFGFNSVTEWSFAMAIGGGLDINLGKNIAIRAAQFDWVPIDSESDSLEGTSGYFQNVRYMFGVVFKF